MKIEYIVFIIIIFGINSIENNSILCLPSFEGRHLNILTKYGYMNYTIRNTYIEFLRFPYKISEHFITGIKNLNLLNLTEFQTLNMKAGDEAILFQYKPEFDDNLFDFLCKILYQTKYIDKMIYFSGILQNKNYKYYGGILEEIVKVKKMKKFTFSKDEKVSKIIVRSREDSNIEIYRNEIIDISNGEQRLIQLTNDKDYKVCIPRNFSKFLDKYEFKKYLERNDKYYKLDERQQKLFESISFILDNKNITFYKEEIIVQSRKTKDYFFDIVIGCDRFIFGKKFMRLFDYLEKNVENGDISLFMSPIKKVITEKEANDEKIKGVFNSIIYSNYYIVILLLSFIVFLMSIALIKNYHKNKKIQYYNEYFNI